MKFLSKEDYELTIDDIKPYLVNPRVKGSEIVCACPLCESGDRRGHHLYIKNTRDKLLVYCQKCNAPGAEIIKEFKNMGAKHDIPEDYITATKYVVEDYDHEYHNPDGSTAYYKHRTKYSDGSKKFSFYYYEKEQHKVFKKPDECNILYNLDLMELAQPGEVLYIVEGEKCADALVGAGLLATTSNSGAKSDLKFSETDKAMLAKFPLKIVIPDNDSKGAEYVKAWNGADVLNLQEIWPECPPKGDIADYLAAGMSIDPIVNFKSYDMSQEGINRLTVTELVSIDFMKRIYKEKDALARQSILNLVNIRAGELHCRAMFKTTWNAFLKDLASKRGNKGNVQNFDNNPIVNGLNCGEWLSDMEGVRRFIKGADDEPECEYASYIPITPSAILKNIENGTEKVELSFYSENEWHSINIQRSIVANNSKIVDLADLGIDVNSGSAKLLVKYLSDVVNMNDSSALPRLQTVSHLGFVQSKFIPYCSDIVTDVGVEYQDTVNAVCESGTLEDWVAYVKPLRKNLCMRITIAASFSSPLVSLVHALPYVLMLYGGTGVGKTVGLQVAASVWGDPAMGKLVKSLNNTINYTMSMLGMLKHLPLFGDELQTIREKYGGYDDMLYRVTEGVDRGRMTNSIVQKINTWENCMIFTGEEPCTKSMSGGGVKNRVIEIECLEKLIDDGHAVSGFVKNNYGCAGPVFIEALQKYDLLEEYRKIYKTVAGLTDSTEKQTMAMSLILLADKISSECIFDDDPISAEDIVDMLKSSKDVDLSERAYIAVCDLISEHTSKFLGDSNVVWGKYSGNLVYFNKTVLEREMSSMGFDFSAVKSKWAEKGYLIKNAQGRYYGTYYIHGQHGNYAIINVIENA